MCDVIFLVGLEGKFDFDHSQEWKVKEVANLSVSNISDGVHWWTGQRSTNLSVTYRTGSIFESRIDKGHDGDFQVEFFFVSPRSTVQVIHKDLKSNETSITRD